MKKDKLKSVVLKFSIVFFIVIALLTYFSKTINNMLLPKVKVVSVQTGVIDDTAGSNDMKTTLSFACFIGGWGRQYGNSICYK